MSELPNLPGYRIEKEIGKGGMATVYLGVQEKLNREVAIKILSPHFLHDDKLAKRFMKEAETSASLNQPNIITIHDVDQVGNNFFIVTEYFNNGSLRDLIEKEGSVGPDRAMEIVSGLAKGLDYAHSKGFIHRDIKPDNIMFREDGTPVLVDFGIARAVGSTTKLTKTGMSIGTPHYMSPEQSRGKTLDGRSDIYALGVVLFEMLSGELPYDSEESDSIAIAIKHIQEPIPDLRSCGFGIQDLGDGEIEILQNLINKMMAKEPGERVATGKEVIELIDQEIGGRKQETEKQHSASSFQPSAEKQRSSENNVGVESPVRKESVMNGDSPESLEEEIHKTLPSINGRQGEFASAKRKQPGLSARSEGKNNKVLYLSLSLIFLVIVTVSIAISSKKNSYYSSSSSSYSGSSYSSRVTLRSSYRTLSESEKDRMLKGKGFFDKYDNKTGNFRNDFRSKTISGDKVVVDRATGLMWHQSGSSKYLNFNEAKEWVRSLNRRGYAGYSDWRLPTLEEGASLLESSKRKGVFIDPVFSSKQWWIWTGDKYGSSSGWVVYFNFGRVHWNYHTIYNYVRPVRRDR